MILIIRDNTQIEQEPFEFLWTLKTVFAFLSSESDKIVSPIFKGGSKSNHEWYVY